VLQSICVSAPKNTAGHELTKNAKWLDAVAKPFDALMHGVYGLPGTGWIKLLLHGSWPLKHPLHPAVTDVVIGAYTAAVALDILATITGEQAAFARPTDFVFIVALVSSLAAVLSGLTDWRETYGEEKRTGMLHGLVMVTATVFFVASIVMRLNAGADARGTAMVLSGVGLIVMLVGAFLGGELPYGYGTGVNRQAFIEHPGKWQRLDLAARGLEDRKPVLGKTKSGIQIFVVSIDGKTYAMGNVCTHAGGPLNEGKWIEREGTCMIECPWHLSLFDVRTGAVRQGPATFPEVRYETRASDDGFLEVRATG